MHIAAAAPDRVPGCDPGLEPPLIRGAAAQAHRAYVDHGLDDLIRFVSRPAATPAEQAALTLDLSFAHALRFRAAQAAELQRAALSACRLYRVEPAFAPRSERPLRLLAVMAPGDLMANTPLDFITGHLDVRLDLLFVVPGFPLPEAVPEHDVAFFAAGDGDAAALARLAPLWRAWPRPALNDPAAVARLTRDGVAAMLADIPSICSPPTIRTSRAGLLAHLGGRQTLPLLVSPGAVLIRPVGSHAGHGLEKADTPAELAFCLERSEAGAFHVSRFVDYRGDDGMFRKFRIAFLDGAPFLCHMAVSGHWMVHYLNADMELHAARREEEARAMASFDAGFAPRHAEAFAALTARFGLDYFQIDCAETPDGRLLVFEADVAAIVHLMDPLDLFPYKPAQMRRVFAAFDAMLHRRAALSPSSPACGS
jgi:hypothetical protein